MKARLLPLMIISLICGCSESRNNDYSPENFNVIRLADGVYACIHKPGGRAIGNSGLVDNGESTIIFDTFLSPDAAEEMLRLVGELKLSPVKYVINSHFDNDHVRGNQVFPPDVKIISTKRTAELIAEEEPKAIAAERIYAPKQVEYFDSLEHAIKGDTSSGDYMTIKLMKPYFEELAESHIKIKTRVPDTYIDKEMRLDGSKLKVVLIDKGKGHTESDLIMYLPEKEILFAGDLLFNEAHPYLGYGYTEELKERLAELEIMKPLIIVPGHGDPGGTEMIRTMAEYIEELEGIVKEMRDAGQTAEDIDRVPLPEKYHSWIVGNYFYTNLKYLFSCRDD